MGLGGLKKQEMDKNVSIDGFIEGGTQSTRNTIWTPHLGFFNTSAA